MILTTSVGVSIYPGHGESASDLLRNADSAMYHAKAQGRNTYAYFTDMMNRDVSRRLVLEEQMSGALRRGEFEVHYQPKINVSNEKVIGAEALLRWTNPALGSVSPDEFIPIAEQTGLIVPIGQFVLTQAMAVTRNWKARHAGTFQMAINLSPRQFREPRLVSFIENAIRHEQLAGTDIELEITEGVLMSGHGYIDDALKAINDLGIEIAMDDFGTGYSSLSYLRRYPFDTLKIDRTFINDVSESKEGRELVSAAIAMAHALGLSVVAEGVETREQLEILKELGCDHAQGFLFSKAVSETELFERYAFTLE
jgi:EAL domain-containing protein (putative c-di-GMP-specific phosphodiesterase class I)